MDSMNEGLRKFSEIDKVKYKIGPFVFSMLLAAHISSHAEEKSHLTLCAASETVLFNCELQHKSASLCFDEKIKLIKYRFGTRVKENLIYPKTPAKNEYSFKLSTTPYPGGGENRIRFANGIYNYFIYDITRSQQDKTSIDSIQTAGIAVYENGKRIANLKCENSETSIYPLAFEILQREEFSHDINTD